jgi:hypothetical protein
MTSQNILQIAIGLFLYLPQTVQGQTPTGHPPDTVAKSSVPIQNGRGLFKNTSIDGGQLTLPFKIRSKADTHSFRLTTDVTVGAFIGLTRKLNDQRDFYLTIPFAAGITFINLNENNNQTLDKSETDPSIVPGLSWGTGLILQMERHSLGIMFGRDYASEVGNQWIYHRKIWWSFGIGFTFFNE